MTDPHLVCHDSSVTRTVLVVDDHEGFRSSMVQALDLIPDVEVAGEARSGDEATLSLVSRVDEGTCVTLRVPTAVPPRTAQLPSFVAAGRA